METKRTRRTYDPAFKIQAARRVAEQHEKPAVVAADLGINVVSLYQWVKEFEKHKAAATQSSGGAQSSSQTENVQTNLPLTDVETPKAEKKSIHKREKVSVKSADPLRADSPRAALDRKTSDAAAHSAASAELPSFVSTPAGFETPSFSEDATQTIRSFEDAPVAYNEQPAMTNVAAAMTEAVPETSAAATGASSGTDALEPEIPAQESASYNERNGKFRNRRDRQKDRRRDFSQQNAPRQNAIVEGEEELPVSAPDVDDIAAQYPTPSASQGRRWKVMHALDQRPNYKEESQAFGYVDEFDLPAENLTEVWSILDHMQKIADRRAFENMVHSKDLNVPADVLADPRAVSMQGPNIPNKPWLRKMRMNPIAEDFFQTTPDYLKSVYESYGGLTMRLAKNSTGTPILLIEKAPEGGKNITINFAKFDRFVDDFYGDFVRDCKTVMMKMNPKEYPGLNAFIRIPDEPIWNPKLWAGVRTFHWKDDETLAEAWIRYATNLKRNNRNQKRYGADF